MKLLLIASFPESIVSFRGRLIQAFLSSGYEVSVAAPGLSSCESVRRCLVTWGVSVHDIPMRRSGTNPVADIVLVLRLFFLMRRLCPDVLLGYTIKPVVYGTLAGWLARVPRRYALVTGLGYAFTGARGGALVRLIRGLYRFSLNRADKTFFQNPDDEALFRRMGILSSGKLSIVVNGSGVDTETFSVAPLPPGTVAFLMIGRLLGDKGVREYARAARAVRVRFPEVRFLLAGWIDENPDAVSAAELNDWVANGDIEFLGKLDDVRPAIAASTVYVLPSYREGTPRTVLEAMSMGRAVITSDAPGCRETVVDGDNGFLVAVKSVDDLAAAMLRFVEQPMLAVRMGLRSRKIAEEKYDVHKVNAGMLLEMDVVSSHCDGERS